MAADLPALGTWGLLERTGLARATHKVEEDGEHVDRAPGQFDPLRDPASADLLAEQLVRSVRGHPQAVIVPEGSGAAVLGFAVALRLGVPVLRLFVDEGLVVLDGEPPPQTRVLVISPLGDDRLVDLAESYLHTSAAIVVDAIALLGTPAARMRSLAHLASRRYPAEQCPECTRVSRGREAESGS